jgi:hypothetical protein
MLRNDSFTKVLVLQSTADFQGSQNLEIIFGGGAADGLVDLQRTGV